MQTYDRPPPETEVIKPTSAGDVPRPCPPSLFIADVLRKDEDAVKELKTLGVEYTPPVEYEALHRRGKEALVMLDEMTALLRSAICICERQGQGTNWDGFADSIRQLGLNGVTARTYRQGNAERRGPAAQDQQ